jgi:hypothetical protein
MRGALMRLPTANPPPLLVSVQVAARQDAGTVQQAVDRWNIMFNPFIGLRRTPARPAPL